jgi:hypothetical protein
MSRHQCACGFLADAREELADHLGEMFVPADTSPAGDVASDSQRHAELSRRDADGTLWECLCGLVGAETQALDAHLLAVFTPPDGIGHDGRYHQGREPA